MKNPPTVGGERDPAALPHHRDAPYLWPVVGLLSMALHLGLYGVLRTVTLEPQVPLGDEAPIPVQLVDNLATPEASLTPQPPTTAQPDGAISPPPHFPEPTGFPAPSDTDGQEPLPENQPEEEWISPEAPGDQPPVPGDVPASPPAPAPAPLPTAPSPTQPPAPGPTPSRFSGTLIPLGITLDPQGRDIPDTLPRLRSTEAIAIQPLLSACGWANLDALGSGFAPATLQLRITVQTSGAISQATVIQGSGQDAIDHLAICLVKQSIGLDPATMAGAPQLTDAALLTIQLR